MSRRVAALAAVASGALALSACASSSVVLAGSRAGAPAGVATWPGPTSGEHLLRSDGRLYSENLDDGSGACFWFVSATGTVVSLVWPRGWSAQASPLAVRDTSGKVVVSTFDEGVEVVGHYEAGRTGCAPGRLSRSFAVARLERVAERAG